MVQKEEYHHIVNESKDEDFSFNQLIKSWMESVRYALSYKKLIIVTGIIGILLGMGYAWIKKTTYEARMTFVVEDAKSSGGSIASALAGQIGLDIGGLGSGTGGVLAGDNVLALLKSNSMIKKALMTPIEDSSIESIADRYAKVYNLKSAWAANTEISKDIQFSVNKTKFTRLEDSLIQTLIKRISEKEMTISKPEKKLDFFELMVVTRDEKISQLLCERLLKVATTFYIETKTRRLTNNVARLQKRADSLGILLNKKTLTAAETNQILLDANPAFSSPQVDAEISTRNKFIESTVYAEIIKNLEISRTSLIQETPTVQIVDRPEFPLKENKQSIYMMGILGGLIGVLSTIAFITFIHNSRKD